MVTINSLFCASVCIFNVLLIAAFSFFGRQEYEERLRLRDHLLVQQAQMEMLRERYEVKLKQEKVMDLMKEAIEKQQKEYDELMYNRNVLLQKLEATQRALDKERGWKIF